MQQCRLERQREEVKHGMKSAPAVPTCSRGKRGGRTYISLLQSAPWVILNSSLWKGSTVFGSNAENESPNISLPPHFLESILPRKLPFVLGMAVYIPSWYHYIVAWGHKLWNILLLITIHRSLLHRDICISLVSWTSHFSFSTDGWATRDFWNFWCSVTCGFGARTLNYHGETINIFSIACLYILKDNVLFGDHLIFLIRVFSLNCIASSYRRKGIYNTLNCLARRLRSFTFHILRFRG